MTNGSYNRLPEIIARLEAELPKALDESANILVREMAVSMSGGKRGRYYKVSKSGKPHRASAPGEAPARDTGALVNSLVTEKSGKFARVIGTNIEYAEALEFGTKSGKLAPRPFMRPAVVKKAKSIIQRIHEAIVRAIM